MLCAVFYRPGDELPWSFVDFYNGEAKDAVAALVSDGGQSCVLDMAAGVCFKMAQAVRVMQSDAVKVDDAPKPFVEQPAMPDVKDAKDA